MSKGKQPKVTAATRAEICEAYLRLYGDGNPKPTVAGLVEEVPCSRATFYRYFPTVEAVFEAIVEENTCTQPCADIQKRVESIPLEEATDLIASFYEERARVIEIIIVGPCKHVYLDRQTAVMKPMFAALVSRALDLTPLQLDYVSQLIAETRTSMIRLWIEKGRIIDLAQINKMWESVVEESIWTQVAFQAPTLGGPYPRTVAERHLYDYPWLGYSGLVDSGETR